MLFSTAGARVLGFPFGHCLGQLSLLLVVGLPPSAVATFGGSLFWPNPFFVCLSFYG